jgi:Trk-type K+ transport system membrane component
MELARLSAFVVVVLAAPPVLRAQATSAPFQDQINAAVKIRVVGAWGRAELAEPSVSAGTIRYSRARALTSFSAPSALPLSLSLILPQPLPLADVTEVQVPAGNDAVHGAVVGGLLLGGLMLVAGVAASSCDACITSGASAGDVISVTLVAGAIGAGIGALLGSTSTRWKTVYRARAASSPLH